MFNPLQDSTDFTPPLAAPKKKTKFVPKSEQPTGKPNDLTLDSWMLSDYWCYTVEGIPAPAVPYFRSWLLRSGNDLSLCLKAIDSVARNPQRFDTTEHAHRTAAAYVNRAVDSRAKAA